MRREASGILREWLGINGRRMERRNGSGGGGWVMVVWVDTCVGRGDAIRCKAYREAHQLHASHQVSSQAPTWRMVLMAERDALDKRSDYCGRTVKLSVRS